MLKNIRAFFAQKDVLEVETPLLSQSSTTDPHLDSLQSRFRDTDCYLNTSPEYAMKRLLASWQRPIYQICKAFRDDELGQNHNPEFTLLEWYQPDYEMLQLMQEMEHLISVLWQSSNVVKHCNKPSFDSFSYQQAFEKFAGINPHQVTAEQCHQVTLQHGVQIPQGLDIDESMLTDWLDWLLTQVVLPAFSQTGFTFLYDYPAEQCSLAKLATNNQGILVAKRFELFFGEIELANGFHELTDANEQLQRFKLENIARNRQGKKPAVIDSHFIAALTHGLPECSGVALGLDRLLMVLTGLDDISKVLSFSWQNA